MNNAIGADGTAHPPVSGQWSSRTRSRVNLLPQNRYQRLTTRHRTGWNRTVLIRMLGHPQTLIRRMRRRRACRYDCDVGTALIQLWKWFK